MRNLLIATGALVAAVLLFVVLRPGDEDEPAAQPGTTLSTTGLETSTQPEPTLPAPPQPPSSSSPPARVNIAVRGGLPVDGVRRVTVGRGRRVILRVTSDVSDHVHLHGYDLMRDVGPGQPAQISFRATLVGTVEAELEDRGVQIATITAKP